MTAASVVHLLPPATRVAPYQVTHSGPRALKEVREEGVGGFGARFYLRLNRNLPGVTRGHGFSAANRVVGQERGYFDVTFRERWSVGSVTVVVVSTVPLCLVTRQG